MININRINDGSTEYFYIKTYYNDRFIVNKIKSFDITCFEYSARGIRVIMDRKGYSLKNCFHTQQECQLACDKLNGKIENENSKSFFHFQKVFE